MLKMFSIILFYSTLIIVPAVAIACYFIPFLNFKITLASALGSAFLTSLFWSAVFR